MNRKMTNRANLPGRLLMAVAAVVCALSLGLGLQTAPGYAAGSFSLTGTYTGGDYEGVSASDYTVAPGSTSTITLYRVGTIAGTDLVIDSALEPYMPADLMDGRTLKGWGTEAPESAEDQAVWTTEWLARAATIDGLIRSNSGLAASVGDDPAGLKVGETSVNLAAGNFSFSGLEAGLYLLSGTSQKLSVYKGNEGMDAYVTPAPMLVQVIGNTTVSLKPQISGAVDEITVVKAWSGDSEAGRPASIKVVLSYDGVEKATLELNKENNWTAKYKTAGDVDPAKWAVSEGSVIAGYTVSRTESEVVSGQKTYTFTNTKPNNPPGPSEYTLELVKKLPVYVDHGKQVSTTFAFEITGYQGSRVVYHRYAGLNFTGAGTESAKVTKIPAGLSRIVVKEMDAAGYKVEGPAEKEATLSGTTYKVEFENTYDTVRYGGGVINKYKVSGGKIRFDFREGIVHE